MNKPKEEQSTFLDEKHPQPETKTTIRKILICGPFAIMFVIAFAQLASSNLNASQTTSFMSNNITATNLQNHTQMFRLPCVDKSRHCPLLQKEGRCNTTFVMAKCPISCNICIKPEGHQQYDEMGIADSEHGQLLNRQDELMSMMSFRLSDGQDVSPGQYPFYVIVTVSSLEGTTACGGALIIDPSGYGKTYAVSAAHCVVFDNYSIASARIGVIAGVTSNDDWSHAVYYKVVNYQHGKDYQSKPSQPWLTADFVILKLELSEGTVDEKYVAPIRITEQDSPSTPMQHATCFVIASGTRPTEGARRVQSADIVWYQDLSEYCWQAKPVSCPGDSGSPVICYEFDAESGKSDYALHGTIIGSTQGGKCTNDFDSYVTFFTKIRKFFDLMKTFTECNHNGICSRI